MKQLTFKDVVIRKREEKGWTQAQLAKCSGISQGSISRIEGGRQKNLTDNLKIKLCQALGITIVVPLDPFEEKMSSYIPELSQEDKITILRFILRLRNTDTEAENIMKEFLESLQK